MTRKGQDGPQPEAAVAATTTASDEKKKKEAGNGEGSKPTGPSAQELEKMVRDSALVQELQQKIAELEVALVQERVRTLSTSYHPLPLTPAPSQPVLM